MLPPRFQPSNETLRLIASIDEFKGEWRVVEILLGNLQTESFRSRDEEEVAEVHGKGRGSHYRPLR